MRVETHFLNAIHHQFISFENLYTFYGNQFWHSFDGSKPQKLNHLARSQLSWKCSVLKNFLLSYTSIDNAVTLCYYGDGINVIKHQWTFSTLNNLFIGCTVCVCLFVCFRSSLFNHHCFYCFLLLLIFRIDNFVFWVCWCRDVAVCYYLLFILEIFKFKYYTIK